MQNQLAQAIFSHNTLYSEIRPLTAQLAELSYMISATVGNSELLLW